ATAGRIEHAPRAAHALPEKPRDLVPDGLPLALVHVLEAELVEPRVIETAKRLWERRRGGLGRACVHRTQCTVVRTMPTIDARSAMAARRAQHPRFFAAVMADARTTAAYRAERFEFHG